MKELRFEYKMRLEFSSLVDHHRFTLKCMPRTNPRQKIEDMEVIVYPNEFLSEARDSFGNLCIYGHAEKKHDHFSFRVTGTAKTGLTPFEPAADPVLLGIYRYQTKYTIPGPAIQAFAGQFFLPRETSPADRAAAYMHGLYSQFRYVPNATNIYTTAEEAMAMGKGVCQDYSHILLSLCRMENIPSRYVVGMLAGEGMSHAWVEICDNGRWIAFDPTNNVIVDDGHIKISAGRDYQDCIVNQGIFTGQTRQTQRVYVSVREARL